MDIFDYIFGKNHKDRKKEFHMHENSILHVHGSGSRIIHLDFKPTEVGAHIIGRSQSYSSCMYDGNDFVFIHILNHKRIEISWMVKERREVSWYAKR